MIDLVVCCGGRSCGPIMNNLSGLSWFNQLYSYTLKIVAIILSQVSSSMSPTATVETTENGFKTNIRLDGEGEAYPGILLLPADQWHLSVSFVMVMLAVLLGSFIEKVFSKMG